MNENDGNTGWTGISDAHVSALTYVTAPDKVTYMVKTQIYFPEEDLKALQSTAKRSGRSVADLVREAVRRVWLRPPGDGPVALWDGVPTRTSMEHDAIYDERR